MSVINEKWTVEERDEPYADFRIKSSDSFGTVAMVPLDDAPVHDYNAAQHNRLELILASPELLRAIYWADRLVTETLPKFNYAQSALDANAIMVLNRASIEISRVSEKFKHTFRHMEAK